jgi:hypothetical protein
MITQKTTKATPKAVKRHYRRKRLAPGQPHAQSKLTDEVQEQICGFIAGGMRWVDACQLSGIHRATAWMWKERGAAGEERYAEFMEAVDLAEIKSKALLVAEIRRDTDWKAKKWLLINRFPGEFRDYITQEISGPNGAPIEMTGKQFVVQFTMPPPDATEFTTVDHQLPENAG